MIQNMMDIKFFDKKSFGGAIKPVPNYQLTNEIHRQIIRKCKREKVYSSFRDNIWGDDLAEMQSLNKYNKGIKYLLCAIDLFSKYAWVARLKDKRRISIVNAIQKILDGSNRKPNKIWLHQGGAFYDKVFKRYLKINNTEMHSACNEGDLLLLKDLLELWKTRFLSTHDSCFKYCLLWCVRQYC